MTVAQLAAGDCLLKEGAVCQTFWFVAQGAMRQYRATDSGDELSLQLVCGPDWLVDHTSFVNQEPATAAIVAYSPCTVVSLSMQEAHSLMALQPAFFQLGKLLDFGVAALRWKDELDKPDERYQYLMEHKPAILQAFPLKYIASYLRMTPETLSRVRQRLSQ